MRSLVRCPIRPLRCLLVLLLVLLLVCAATQAIAAGEIQVESPSFTFDSENRIYHYQEAKVTFHDLTLEALDVQVFTDTSEVKARGQVRLRDKSLFISADHADFNADNGQGTIYNARLYDSKSGYYLTSPILRRLDKDTYEGTSCELTACPPFVPGWRISASKINYNVDNFATGTNAVLEVGDVPIYWFPIFAWPTVERRTSGFLQPSYSQWLSSLDRFNLGSRVQVPYFWAIAQDQDLTITPEWIEKRGTAYGLDYRYAFVPGQFGRIKFFGIDEKYARSPGQENDILKPGDAEEQNRYPSRYTLEFSHNQSLGDSGRLVLSMVNSSDGQVWREYDRTLNYRPELTYQASITNQADWGDIGVTAEHRSEFRDESIYDNKAAFTDGGDRPALLPRVFYNGAVKPKDDVPVTLQLSSFATNFVTKNDLSGSASLARPALVVPLSLAPGVELRTTLSRTFVDYEGLYRTSPSIAEPATSQGYSQSEALVELRGDLSRVYRRDDTYLQAVKHTISPRLIFDAVQDTEQPLADLVVRTQVARELVTLRLDNTWLGKLRVPPSQVPMSSTPPPFTTDPAPANPSPLPGLPASIAPPISELGTLNLIQRYNLLLEDKNYQPVGPTISSRQETEPGEPLLPLIAQGTLQLGPVGLSSELHYHHQLRRITESLISMSGTVRTNSSLGISYSQNEFAYRTPENVLHPEGTTFGFNGEVPLADQFSVGFNGTLNLATQPAPLGRRLQDGLLFIDFHPICYRVRLTYEESLELTQNNGANQYFVNRRIAFTFDLGSLLSGTQQRVVATGPGL